MRSTTMHALGALLWVGCGGGVQEFQPAEKMTAQAPVPDGYPAAEYEMDVGQIEIGETKVWSNGAYRTEIDGRAYTVIEIGLEIENTLAQPIDLRQIQLDSLTADNVRYEDRRPARIVGRPEIEAGEERMLTVFFYLPPQVEPDDVDAFRLEWSVGTDGLHYDQNTPFLQRPEPPAPRMSYYYTPFYDPFLHDPFYHPGVHYHPHPYLLP